MLYLVPKNKILRTNLLEHTSHLQHFQPYLRSYHISLRKSTIQHLRLSRLKKKKKMKEEKRREREYRKETYWRSYRERTDKYISLSLFLSSLSRRGSQIERNSAIPWIIYQPPGFRLYLKPAGYLAPLPQTICYTFSSRLFFFFFHSITPLLLRAYYFQNWQCRQLAMI